MILYLKNMSITMMTLIAVCIPKIANFLKALKGMDACINDIRIEIIARKVNSNLVSINF
jgi:hypothetical protein